MWFLTKNLYFYFSKKKGIELGVAETSLMKAIAQSTGRTVSQIKSDAQNSGDLGIVAEHSKTNQRMIFKPARLTVKGVFDKLKEIAQMTGHAVSFSPLFCTTQC